MDKFTEKLRKFMYGRNGIDSLCFFFFIIYTLLVVLNLFLHTYIVLGLELLAAGYIIFRVLSKNVYQRQKENTAYLKVQNKVISFFVRQKNKIRDIKTHRYIKCKACKAKLRVKRNKGKHKVRCPKCGEIFEVTIH
ncbi:MAG: hypothetical protein Q4D44_01025 [Eubacteriales bacterium]|nr:hypothetical protein [Eubacteriales bacterium]